MCLLLLFSLVVILCVDMLHAMLRVVADMCCVVGDDVLCVVLVLFVVVVSVC